MSRVLIWSLALVLLVGAAVLAGRGSPPVAPAQSRVTPRDAELARCQRLGEAAGQDARCQAAWARARARFFGEAGA
jgi:conjugative transfer region protein TrbK